MLIFILDSFYEASHRQWAEGLQSTSIHHIDIFSLSPHHWKWSMHGGSIELAAKVNDQETIPDLMIVTDMIDLSLFRSLLSIRFSQIPILLYFHENQITYPSQHTDHHYGFINFTSCLIADGIAFNSIYHKDIFISSLPSFLNMFPKNDLVKHIPAILQKSSILGIGFHSQIDRVSNLHGKTPVILWNHRWEHDKNPELFFNTLFQLKEDGVRFKLIVLGKSYQRSLDIFNRAKVKLATEILHFGFVEDRASYQKWIRLADIIPVTSNQDFFGISAVEAMRAGLYPILPDRLAFPEHLPVAHRSSCLYSGDEEFYQKLKSILVTPDYNVTKEISSFLTKYDWGKLIADYEKVFGDLMKSSNPK